MRSFFSEILVKLEYRKTLVWNQEQSFYIIVEYFLTNYVIFPDIKFFCTKPHDMNTSKFFSTKPHETITPMVQLSNVVGLLQMINLDIQRKP